MKTPRFARICVLVLIGAGMGIAYAKAIPVSHQSTDLRTYPGDEGQFGKLEGRGKLVYQELYEQSSGGFPAFWHNTYTYYPYGDQRKVFLNCSFRAMNKFLAAEIRRPSTVRTFLKDHIVEFLLDNFSDDNAAILGCAPGVITQQDVDQGIGNQPEGLANRNFPAATRAKLKAKLQRYARPMAAMVAGNFWTLDVNVMTAEGAVEHWVAKGRVKPLQIDSFLCELKEPAGTFFPMHVFH